MNTLVRFLFPVRLSPTAVSLLLLAFRIIFGALLFAHGIQKWENFSTLSGVFPDPVGVGSTVSLSLAFFAEVVCSLGFMFGAFYRLAMLPMIFTMLMALFVVHASDPFAVKELALVYLVVFVLMYFAGPGKYSFDYWIGQYIRKRNSEVLI